MMCAHVGSSLEGHPTTSFEVKMILTSLISKLHPLMRRNGLVNQVEFLGLQHTFATVSPSNVQKHFKSNSPKKPMGT